MKDRKYKEIDQKYISADSQSMPSGTEQSHFVQNRIKERMDLAYIVESLKDILISSGNMTTQLIITDEKGYVLYLLNNMPVDGVNIKEGSCMDEGSSGINALGSAVASHNAAKIVGEDHSLSIFKKCVSMGIPILYENKLIGCVGYILPLDTLNTVRSGILDNVIGVSLEAAKKMLEARKSLDELHLLKKFFNHLDNNQCNMVVNVNLNIVQLNRQAEIFLGLPKEDLTGSSLYKIADNLNDNLFGSGTGLNFNNRIIMHTTSGKKPIAPQITPVYSDGDCVVGWHICFAQAIEESSRDSRMMPNKYEFRDIVGKNKDFIRLLGLANAVAKSPSNVLLTGESGTGKELFAQAIHNASLCANGPFVAINCAAIPKELIETELFGYEEGAFTGARRKGLQGKFQMANGGSLFLDEIGDMPLELQAKLLRVLQERTVIPIGGSKPIHIDIRLISATNQNLRKMISENKFRSDLFYRLNVINLRLPVLRDRKDDIPLLVQHFLTTMNKKLYKNVIGISNEAIEYLMDYDWPGNIRELENTVETAVNLTDDYIELEHVDFLPVDKLVPNAADSIVNHSISSLEEVEKMEIIKALNQCNGHVSQTAAALGIGRATLYRKIKKYQISAHVRSE